MIKLLYLLLGAVLLAAYCDGTSIRAADSALQVEDRDFLQHYSTSKFKDLLEKTISNGKKWLANAHKEIGTMTRRNEKTQKLDEQIVEFLTKERQLDGIHDEEKKLQKMAFIFGDVLDLSAKYNISKISNPHPELKNLAALMTRTGKDEFDAHFAEDLLQCTEQIVDATQRYVNSLSPTEKRKERELVSWLNDYNSEDDYNKEIYNFSIFFNILDTT